MSIILYTNALGIPCLISDLLISGHETDDPESIVFPDHITGINNAFPKGSGYVPRSLKRKLFIIANNLALGLSGARIHMAAFVDDLREVLDRKRHIEMGELQEILDAYARDEHGSNVLANISAMIVLREDHITRYAIVGASAKDSFLEASTKNVGSVLAIGSGQSTLLEEVERIDSYRLQMPPAAKPFGRTELAISWNLSLISQLNKIDSLSHRSLLEYWGGSYELIYFDFMTSQFRFLERYTFVYWFLDVCSKEPELLPMGFVSYFHGVRQSLYVVSSQGVLAKFFVCDVGKNEVSTDGFEDSFEELNSGQVTNLIVIARSMVTENIVNFSNSYSSDKKGLVFVELDDDGKVEILIQSEFRESLISSIVKRFAGEAT